MDAGRLLVRVGAIICWISLTGATGTTVLAVMYAASANGHAMVRMLVMAMGLGIVWSGVTENRADR